MLHEFLTAFQFVIALNIVEDFLAGEGYKFLRLVRVFNPPILFLGAHNL
jgi:hypothetical protein